MPNIAERLKQRRRALGLTLEQAAKMAGFKNFQTLSKIENGYRELKANELIALAKAYSFDINLFLLNESKSAKTQIFWRANPNPPTDKSIENKFQMFFERYLHLEKILERPEPEFRVPKFEFTKMDFNVADKKGEEYSELLKLGDRPALSLSSILENDYHLPIFYLELPEGASAISIIVNTNTAICVNSFDAPWRRNFDIAHELFHMIYKKSIPNECGTTDESFNEKCANAFASALLLPKDILEKEIRMRKKKTTISNSTLITMAYDFGVSLAALIWRLVNINRLKRSLADKILSSDAVQEFDKNIRKKKSWSTPHISKKYLSMVFEAVSRGLMSKMRAAEYLGISVGILEDIFLKAGLVLVEESDIEITL